MLPALYEGSKYVYEITLPCIHYIFAKTKVHLEFNLNIIIQRKKLFSRCKADNKYANDPGRIASRKTKLKSTSECTQNSVQSEIIILYRCLQLQSANVWLTEIGTQLRAEFRWSTGTILAQ